MTRRAIRCLRMVLFLFGYAMLVAKHTVTPLMFIFCFKRQKSTYFLEVSDLALPLYIMPLHKIKRSYDFTNNEHLFVYLLYPLLV